ncbi:hypothetical protein M5689_002312 [Euphorbia peplus]|nr:hypothetical protein M5689_002312 [Euphorbia peplus]
MEQIRVCDEQQLERCLKDVNEIDRFLATLIGELNEFEDQHKALICKKDKLKSSLAKREKDIQKCNDQICDPFWATLQDELKEVDDQRKVLICKKDELVSSLAKLEKDIQINNDQILKFEEDYSLKKSLKT